MRKSEIGDLVNYMFTVTRSDYWTCEVLSELSWRRLMKLCLVIIKDRSRSVFQL
jgi:hypothetical protein